MHICQTMSVTYCYIFMQIFARVGLISNNDNIHFAILEQKVYLEFRSIFATTK